MKSDVVQAINAPNIYVLTSGTGRNPYYTCKSDMEKSPYNSYSGDFCFLTSEGRVAFANVTRTREDHAFVIHVVVQDSRAG